MTYPDEQTKARIHAEERYRAQVRADLEAGQRQGSALLRTVAALVIGVLLMLLLLGEVWFLAQPVEPSPASTVPAPSSAAQP
ncbi:MAG: hypothetical protein Q4C67_04230 [Deinococcus sp.]|nr:hypothetical protein [Deinococcus sp.]